MTCQTSSDCERGQDHPGRCGTNSARWQLGLSSFEGIVAGASHYMVRLEGTDTDVEVYWILDADGAKSLSTRDYEYRVGSDSNRFLDEDDALGAGLAAFRHVAAERDVLFRGSHMPDCMDDVVYAPSDLLSLMESFTNDDEWNTLYGRFVRHVYQTRFGPGHESPRTKMVVTVRRVDGGWVVEG